MFQIANQIVCVYAWLSNFLPALIPLPPEVSEEEVDDYFVALDTSGDSTSTSEED